MGSRGWLATLLFLASGAAALVVEVTWQRWFRALLGATAPATAAVLVAFFAGQGLGALAGVRLARSRPRPLMLYGALELGAAGAALATLPLLGLGEFLLGAVYDDLRRTPSALIALRFAVALAASLPAALCYGASWPALARALLPGAQELGRLGSLLYGANLLGAMLGALGAALVLPERIGVPATYGLGVALSAGAGLAALALARGLPEAGPEPAPGPTPRPEPARGRRRQRPKRPPRFGAFAFLSGFGVLAFQVLAVHAFAQVLNQSVAAFGLVLTTVLASLALGALLVSALERSAWTKPVNALSFSLAGVALTCAAFPALLVGLTDGLRYVGSADPWPGYLLTVLGLVLASAGTPLLAAGLVYPLVLAAAGRARPGDSVAGLAGRLAAWNTAGAVTGALAAAFLLLPAFGPWLPFALLAVPYALASVALPLATPGLRIWRDAGLALGWILVISRGSPLDLPVVRADAPTLLALDTTPAGTVAVVQREGERLLQIDNHYALGGTAERVHEERQGHLPLLLASDARRVVHLGSATAISAGAATAHPVERLVLVELVPGVSRMAERFFRDANRAVYEDTRTHVVLDDARSFVRLTQARFDAVVADLFVPWRAGTGALYTSEHFRAVRARLEDGGLFCQWLPLYQLSQEEFRIVSATFLDVFPDAVVFRGDFYGAFPIVALVGWKGAPPPPARVDAAVARLAAAGERDRWVTDPAGFWALYVGPLAPLAPAFAGQVRQSDSRPVLEFLAMRAHAGGEQGKRDPFVGVAWARTAARILEAGRADADPFLAQLSDEARRAVGGGAALQLAGALYAEERSEEAAHALALASELLPPRLFRDAPADPTAAEVWHDL